MLLRLGFAILFIATFVLDAEAQSDTSVYKGLRISLFNVSIKKQKAERLSLQLSLANTGRLPVSFGKKNEAPPENLVIELDTVNLPFVLQGRESLLTEAVRKQKVSLQPGEILEDMSVEVAMTIPDTAAVWPPGDLNAGPMCPDLVFDTAYIVQYTESKMLLRFIIRNAGNSTARLLGDANRPEDNLAVNVYFVAGSKLTRGAILADGIFIQAGRETLDGLLLPGQWLQGDIEIDLSKRTKFAPNLVFELDPFQTVHDCNRADNTKSIKVEF